MGKNDAKKQAEEDKRRWEAALNAALQTQQKVDPLEERLKAGNMSFLDAVEGKGKPFDIRDPRLGLAPNLALYDSAVNNQDAERMGTGAIQMGLNASNPNLTALLSEQRKAHAQQDAAGGLERAFSLRNAEVRGSALPLIGIGQARNATSLGALSGLYGGAADRRNQLAMRPGFWEQLALAAVGSAGQAAGAYLGGS